MMNQEDIFRKIGLILEELQDQYAYLARNQQQLNELELELFMANANFLSDHVQIVRKLNSAKIVKEIPEHSTQDLENEGAETQLTWERPSAVQQQSNHVLESANQESTAKVSPEASKAETAEFNFFKSDETSAEKPLEEVQSIPVNITEENAAGGTFLIEETPNPNELFTASSIEKESFKLENEPSTFEFILKDIGTTDKFDFEEKSVDDIFDRVLSPEEERIIAEKQKLRAQEVQDQEIAPQQNEQPVNQTEQQDELGPEPFLVAKEELLVKEEAIVPPAVKELQVDPIAEKMVVTKTVLDEVTPEAENISESPAAVAKPMSLNERLASQLGKAPNTTNTDSQRNTLTDLKHGINLNDKMLYIKDLFNGYNLAYAEVIDLLNKMSDFKTADAFLQNNYAEKNNWAGKSATVTKFYELLHQRFPAK